MGNHKQEVDNGDDSFDSIGLDSDIADSVMGDFSDETYEHLSTLSSRNRALAEKRRLVELRLEERKLREELGDYDLDS